MFFFAQHCEFGFYYFLPWKHSEMFPSMWYRFHMDMTFHYQTCLWVLRHVCIHHLFIYLFTCILKLHVIFFFFFLNNTLVFRTTDKFRIRGILRWLKTYGMMVLLQCVLIVVVQYTTWTWTLVPWVECPWDPLAKFCWCNFLAMLKLEHFCSKKPASKCYFNKEFLSCFGVSCISPYSICVKSRSWS